MKDGSISIGFGGILFIVFLILKLTIDIIIETIINRINGNSIDFLKLEEEQV